MINLTNSVPGTYAFKHRSSSSIVLRFKIDGTIEVQLGQIVRQHGVWYTGDAPTNAQLNIQTYDATGSCVADTISYSNSAELLVVADALNTSSSCRVNVVISDELQTCNHTFFIICTIGE